MRVATTRRSALVIGVGAMLVGSMLAGCGNGSSAGTKQADSNGPVTLTVNLFGDFGYTDLYAKYHAAHPNVTVKENVTDYNTHHKNLQAHLLAGSGTADIEAIEIGQIAGVRPQSAKFVDFLKEGVKKDQWVPSKYEPATSTDGKALF